MTPIHLEGYRFIDELMTWKKSEKTGENRHWSIRLWDKSIIMCNLSWRFGDSQLGGVDKAATNAEEAVWLALEEFRKWEESQ